MPGIGAGKGQVQQKLLLRVPQMHHFTRTISGVAAQQLHQIVVLMTVTIHSVAVPMVSEVRNALPIM